MINLIILSAVIIMIFQTLETGLIYFSHKHFIYLSIYQWFEKLNQCYPPKKQYYICIPERRISTKRSQTTNKDLPVYNIEQTPTAYSPGGILIYICQSLSYKHPKRSSSLLWSRTKICFYFLLIPNKKHNLIGAVYEHPSKKAHKFDSEFLNNLLTNLSIENKSTIIGCDFNLNLIKYLQNRGKNQFLEDLLSNNFILQ